MVFTCRERECHKLEFEVSKNLDASNWYPGKSKELINKTGAQIFEIGSLYANAVLSRILMPDHSYDILMKWMKEQDSLLLIQGSPGTGKTYISAAVLNYYYDEKKEVFFTNHRRFTAKIQEGFSKNHTQDYSVNLFAYKDILIFDDLGAATNTEWQQETILDLVDKRISMKKKTLITTNLSNNQLKETLGERTASRLISTNNHHIQLWTRDLRMEKLNDERP